MISLTWFEHAQQTPSPCCVSAAMRMSCVTLRSTTGRRWQVLRRSAVDWMIQSNCTRENELFFCLPFILLGAAGRLGGFTAAPCVFATLTRCLVSMLSLAGGISFVRRWVLLGSGSRRPAGRQMGGAQARGRSLKLASSAAQAVTNAANSMTNGATTVTAMAEMSGEDDTERPCVDIHAWG